MYGYPVKTTELVAGKSWGAFEQFTWVSTPVGKIKVLWVLNSLNSSSISAQLEETLYE